MRRLYLIRHAKSDWGDPDLSDFERPLNPRGNRAAPMMGTRLRERGVKLDAMICSPAKRAQTTAHLIASEIGFETQAITEESRLYLASPDEIEEVLWAVDDGLHSVALIGHNPGMTEFANRFSSDPIDNLPTCAVVSLTLDIASWPDACLARVREFDFDYPKKKEGPR